MHEPYLQDAIDKGMKDVEEGELEQFSRPHILD
jgi:hypothetical protein